MDTLPQAKSKLVIINQGLLLAVATILVIYVIEALSSLKSKDQVDEEISMIAPEVLSAYLEVVDPFYSENSLLVQYDKDSLIAARRPLPSSATDSVATQTLSTMTGITTTPLSPSATETVAPCFVAITPVLIDGSPYIGIRIIPNHLKDPDTIRSDYGSGASERLKKAVNELIDHERRKGSSYVPDKISSRTASKEVLSYTRELHHKLPFRSYTDFGELDKSQNLLVLSLEDSKHLVRQLNATSSWGEISRSERLTVRQKEVVSVSGQTWSPSPSLSFTESDESIKPAGAIGISSESEIDFSRKSYDVLSPLPKRTVYNLLDDAHAPAYDLPLGDFALDTEFPIFHGALFLDVDVAYSYSPDSQPSYLFGLSNKVVTKKMPARKLSTRELTQFNTKSSRRKEIDPVREIVAPYAFELDERGLKKFNEQISAWVEQIEISKAVHFNQKSLALQQRLERLEQEAKREKAREAQEEADRKKADSFLTLDTPARVERPEAELRSLHLDGTDIKIPTPSGYLELAEIHTEWSAAYKRAKFDGVNEVFLTYLREACKEDFENGNLAGPHWGYIYEIKVGIDDQSRTYSFEEFSTTLDQLCNFFAAQSALPKESLKQLESNLLVYSKNSGTPIDMNIEDQCFFEPHFRSKDALVVSGIFKGNVNGIERHSATSAAFVNIEGKAIQVSATAPIKDFKWTRDAVQVWLQQIQVVNASK